VSAPKARVYTVEYTDGYTINGTAVPGWMVVLNGHYACNYRPIETKSAAEAEARRLAAEVRS
jgi:hypothetical protein